MRIEQRIVLAGGSGFLGQTLLQHLIRRHYDIAVLTRSPESNGGLARERFWNGCTIGDWAEELDGALALINLAGRSVNCRYHARNRRLILESRVHSTRVLGEVIAKCAQPP